MLRNNIDVSNEIERIFTTREYGDILSYEYLERLLEAQRDEILFTVKMGKIKNELIEYGYVLSCILNEGYKILYPNEIVDEVMKKCVKTSLNKIGKGLKIMKYTDRDYLDQIELRAFETFENTLNKMYSHNENCMLNLQAVLNDVKQKELEAK